MCQHISCKTYILREHVLLLLSVVSICHSVDHRFTFSFFLKTIKSQVRPIGNEVCRHSTMHNINIFPRRFFLLRKFSSGFLVNEKKRNFLSQHDQLEKNIFHSLFLPIKSTASNEKHHSL